VPKATSLTPEALTPQQTTPLAATKQRGQKDAPKKTIKPIQFRPSEEQAWEIKTAASAEHMNTWKNENMKSADDPFIKHLPDNPFRADAWLSCLRGSVTELERLATFRTNI
jgi:hypothetical protein